MTRVRGTRNVVVRDVERVGLTTVDQLAPIGTSTVHEAIGRRGYLGPHITPIQKGIQVAGTAITVLNKPGDNGMILSLIHI